VARSVSTTSTAADAWRCLHDLFFSPAHHERLQAACEAVDLSPGLMKALLSIEPGQPKPMKELSVEWRCDASYVTSLVDGLEERGIVARQVQTNDRRAKSIVLTAEGERKRAELLRQLHRPPEFFAVLSAAEQRVLRDLLTKLVAAAQYEGKAAQEA
jgi:MarR family transcriptional regulator, organic hydroperoxide resistance regulator